MKLRNDSCTDYDFSTDHDVLLSVVLVSNISSDLNLDQNMNENNLCLDILIGDFLTRSISVFIPSFDRCFQQFRTN